MWVIDNYIIDVIINDDENKATIYHHRLDIKSNVLVGWNITKNSDSN